ncbi:MAG: hypothetical protein ACXACX_20635 [Candidatus Hodarchaeales archaeon]|jgi:hypothetical protein
MLLQTIFDVLANIIGSILLFLMPIIVPIGQWMVGWISAGMDFLRQNFGTNLTPYIIICVVLVVSGIIINIIWPGDKQGSIFHKGVEKIEDFEEKIEKTEEKDVVADVKRCKDCGNPVGDSEICPLCGARQI